MPGRGIAALRRGRLGGDVAVDPDATPSVDGSSAMALPLTAPSPPRKPTISLSRRSLSGSRLKLAAMSTRVAPGLSSDLSTVTGLRRMRLTMRRSRGPPLLTMSRRSATGVDCGASAARSLRPGCGGAGHGIWPGASAMARTARPRWPCRTGARRLPYGFSHPR